MITPCETAQDCHSLTIYDQSDHLNRLAAPWRELETRDSRARVFQTFTWVSQLWQLDHGPNVKLQIVAVHQPDGRLAALAPMLIRPALTPFGVRILRFIGQDFNDFQDILLADDCDQAQTLDLLAQGLGRVHAQCDLMDLSNIPESAHIIEHRSCLLPDHEVGQTHITQMATMRWVDSTGGLAAYEAGLGTSTRKNLRQQWRRLTGREGAVLRVFSRCEEADPVIADLIRMHQARQHARGQRGLFRNAQRIEVLTGMFRAMALEGSLKLYALCDGEQLLAVQAVLRSGHTASAYTFGWSLSPKLSRYGIGNLLQYKIIEDTLTDPTVTEFDLGIGDEPYKASLAKHTRPIYRLTCRRTGLRISLYDLRNRSLNYAYHSPWVQRLYFALRPRPTRPGR